ncbi:MAG: hydrogenase expression/formation protein HypE [Kosmotoga sp.]|nr:hydrogenase expression/formation protein HypE [Kosmotoga sp.]MBO8167286.1 hydrogenase expression/formation protein HypE [Kosmotoga sp.]
MDGTITIHHNSGKRQIELLKFIEEHLNSTVVSMEEDAGVIAKSVDVVSTDSFTVYPLFFPGGDIGKLAVTGSVNDVVMLGAEPIYMTLSIILEEGFSLKSFECIINSLDNELRRNNLKILCGDTKVMNKGSLDGLVINTTCFGKSVGKPLSVTNVEPGNAIVLTGPIGLHGATIMALRKGFDVSFNSDCRSLTPLLEIVKAFDIRTMRDATRGGVAQILNEIAASAGCDIVINEDMLLVPEGVKVISEILGIDPLYLACEGTAAIFCSERDTGDVMDALNDLGFYPSFIGYVREKSVIPRVMLKNRYGVERVLPMLVEELTPRIC